MCIILLLLMSGRAAIKLPNIEPVRNNIKYLGELTLIERMKNDRMSINTDSSENMTDAIPAETKCRP